MGTILNCEKCESNHIHLLKPVIEEIYDYLKCFDFKSVTLCDNPTFFKIEFKDDSSFYLFPDRWLSSNKMIKDIIESRLGNFRSIFARKCKLVHQTSDNIAQFKQFLSHNHFYGDAKSKYYIGLQYDSQLVAVASFSKSRPLPRSQKDPLKQIPKSKNPLLNHQHLDTDIVIVDSYEWVRYASLSGVRVVGGMGRLLKEFERMVCIPKSLNGNHYEIMSYADLEFSGGEAYKRLGFFQIGKKDPIEFAVLKRGYSRVPLQRIVMAYEYDILYTFHNLGSCKFLKPYKDPGYFA